MGRLRWGQFLPVFVALAFLFLGACGGHKPGATSPFVARITLNPGTSASLQLGGTLTFTASAQNGTGGNISPGFSFVSSDTSVLTMSPNGVACAGTWNAPLYSVCTAAGTGMVQVTAVSQGASSPPTLVFVHPPIENIQISLVPPVNSPPPACPTQMALPEACHIPFNSNPYCISQNQLQTLQAKAYSQGSDITSSVGPFTWSSSTTGAVTLTPVIDPTLNVATNQVTATPNTPGQTEVFATATGVSSQAYPFETCPVQCIVLQVGSGPTGPTSFIVNKGTSETITATAVDVQGCIVPKPALTWTSTQPASILAGSGTSGCVAGTVCAVTTPQAGAASITASCTPPSCNVGFPLNPLNLSPPYVPQPVYPVTAISALATPATTSTGTPSTFNVLASSLDCASNAFCAVALYNVSSAKSVAGNPIQLPTPPNSLIVDPAGDKAYMGSQYGAQELTTANLGGSMSPFTSLPAAATPTGTVTGKALATSFNGNFAVFSDTVSTPNQVYVVNASSANPSSTALNITGATTAAFSRDGLKAFIIACIPGSVSCSAAAGTGNTLYVYSAVQTLQSIPLTFAANAVVFSSSGTFALISGGSSTAASALTVNTCDNSTNGSLSLSSLPGQPLFLKMVPAANVLIPQIPTPASSEGLDFFFGIDSTGLDVIATNSAQPPLSALCPQTVTQATFTQEPQNTVQPFAVHIPFVYGSFNPIAFFLSPDNTQVYLVTSDNGVLVYSFQTGSVSAIALLNSITGAAVSPVAADMTPDGTLLFVAASDGTLHQISTILATDVTPQIGFPPIPDGNNGFCVNGISLVNCTLNLVVVKP